MSTIKNVCRFAIVICCACAATSVSVAETYVPNPPRPISRPVIIRGTKPIGSRPKAPSRQEIACTYSDDCLYFGFAIPEGECRLTMTDLNTGEVVYADFDSETPEPVYIGYHDSGEISISTEQGNTYTGSW